MAIVTSTPDLFDSFCWWLKTELDKCGYHVNPVLNKDYHVMLDTHCMTISFDGFCISAELPKTHFLFGVSDPTALMDSLVVNIDTKVMTALWQGQGTHPLAVVGGYAHGEVIKANLEHGMVLVAGELELPLTAPSLDAVSPNDSLPAFMYEVANYYDEQRGPSYFLVPKGEHLSESFIKRTLKEFPVLGFLPASRCFLAPLKTKVMSGTHLVSLSQFLKGFL